MDDFGVMGLASLAELNYLRLEAMDLFERCLTEGSPDSLEAFIEEQISKDPPRLELLREVGEDLHQRLLALREYHYDVLARVWGTLSQDFGMQADSQLERHHMLDVQIVIRQLQADNPNLTQQDRVLLQKMLDTSLSTAAQLREDICMTEALYGYVMDWVDGLNATVARRYWADGRGDHYTGGVQ
jgi:hypothetical protein